MSGLVICEAVGWTVSATALSRNRRIRRVINRRTRAIAWLPATRR